MLYCSGSLTRSIFRYGDPGGNSVTTTPPGKIGCGAYGASVAGAGFGTAIGAGRGGNARGAVPCAPATPAATHATNTPDNAIRILRFGIAVILDRMPKTISLDTLKSALWLPCEGGGGAKSVRSGRADHWVRPTKTSLVDQVLEQTMDRLKRGGPHHDADHQSAENQRGTGKPSTEIPQSGFVAFRKKHRGEAALPGLPNRGPRSIKK